ncbi:hypothetical protein [Helicobacter sp. 11S02629-2]|uniref:hypothetical protein n=1 Tax=Helicobacter sp. 11S02629-2 TaxID=1476195 RepID=UPI000BA53208|nr:hypothetical protein [Helicobacter sp. 11S02629-2]PAF45367.1 hypothetical protein BKH40_04025 [Helicobacter sp. 11S02629-2]
MYRKLLSLAYVYEIKGNPNKSKLIYEKILELKDSTDEALTPLELYEAKLGTKAINHIESKSISGSLNTTNLKDKIDGIKTQDESVIRWLYRWN